MADLNRMERTWLCSVVFTDIIKYSSQSVELQMKWKARFNGYLANAIREVPEDERVILDTGDGAAICFLGAPEAAMFAALELWQSFMADEREHQPGLRVRIGINLGPVKLVKDINGALNAIGDGINAGQRIMSFAAENQILVSQSFFEVVSRVSDDYKALFKLKGVETDKHVREHTVYSLFPPGSDRGPATVVPSSPAPAPIAPAAALKPTPASNAESKPSGGSGRTATLLAGGLALAVVAAAGAWYFFGRGTSTNQNLNTNSAPKIEVGATTPAAAPSSAAPTPAIAPAGKSARSEKSAPAEPSAAVTASSTPVAKQPEAPANAPKETPPASPPSASSSAVTPADDVEAPQAGIPAEARSAYGEGLRLLNGNQAAASVAHFDEAIRLSPNYFDAHTGRAEARRVLGQYETSLDDCNKMLQINSKDARGHNCLGHGYLLLKQYDKAIQEFDEALRKHPRFAMALDLRGNAHVGLQQYEKAIQDYTQALELLPKNGEYHFKRGQAFMNLKQYPNAIADFTEAIRAQPNHPRGYLARATAEESIGDLAAAKSDRRQGRGMRKEKE